MTKLETCPVGTRCRILAVVGEEPCVRRAKELGLVEGACCSVERRAPFRGPVEISTGRSRLGVRLGKELTVTVEVLDAEQSYAARMSMVANPG